jgi:hypothetical protein
VLDGLDRRCHVAEQRLYQLVRQSRPTADGQFETEFLDSGAIAFTFG